MRLSLLILAVGLAGCAPFPQVPTTADPDAPAPELIPLEPLLAQADAVGARADDGSADVAARAAALRARAARLRGPVVDQGTRARMQDADIAVTP